MRLEARLLDDPSRIVLEINDDRIASVEHLPPTESAYAAKSPYVAPAFWDIQTNGRWGVSFSDPDLTVDQVAVIVRAQAALGTARLCPTLITAPWEATTHGVKTIAACCDQDPQVARMVLGIHLEGPYLSSLEGYRGAHPEASLRNPDWDEFHRWQDASGGRVRLLTIAPERPGSIPFIEKAVESGVVVAIGHTAADALTLHKAVSAGATLSTHLGNGIASPLARHPNPIWLQAANDCLHASLIADGHHLSLEVLRVLARAKTAHRTILVSDASPLAGLPVGRYGDWAVDSSGKIVVAGTPYLAGSNQGLETGVQTLQNATGWPLHTVLDCCSARPAALLRYDPPKMASGEPANLIRFEVDPGNGAFCLVETYVDGQLTAAGPDQAPPTWARRADSKELPWT